MPVTDVTNSGQAAAPQLTEINRNVGKDLGKDDFLKILVAQLQNQDPMSPMEDTAFVAQLAQFSSLEQMQALNSSQTFGQAYDLIGKNVYSTVNDESGQPQQVYGKVTGVLSSGGAAYLEVDGASYIPFTNDIVVYEPEVGLPEVPETGEDDTDSAVETTGQTDVTDTNTDISSAISSAADTTNDTDASNENEIISLGDPTTRVMDY